MFSQSENQKNKTSTHTDLSALHSSNQANKQKSHPMEISGDQLNIQRQVGSNTLNEKSRSKDEVPKAISDRLKDFLQRPSAKKQNKIDIRIAKFEFNNEKNNYLQYEKFIFFKLLACIQTFFDNPSYEQLSQKLNFERRTIEYMSMYPDKYSMNGKTINYKALMYAFLKENPDILLFYCLIGKKLGLDHEVEIGLLKLNMQKKLEFDKFEPKEYDVQIKKLKENPRSRIEYLKLLKNVNTIKSLAIYLEKITEENAQNIINNVVEKRLPETEMSLNEGTQRNKPSKKQKTDNITKETHQHNESASEDFILKQPEAVQVSEFDNIFSGLNVFEPITQHITKTATELDALLNSKVTQEEQQKPQEQQDPFYITAANEVLPEESMSDDDLLLQSVNIIVRVNNFLLGFQFASEVNSQKGIYLDYEKFICFELFACILAFTNIRNSKKFCEELKAGDHNAFSHFMRTPANFASMHTRQSNYKECLYTYLEKNLDALRFCCQVGKKLGVDYIADIALVKLNQQAHLKRNFLYNATYDRQINKLINNLPQRKNIVEVLSNKVIVNEIKEASKDFDVKEIDEEFIKLKVEQDGFFANLRVSFNNVISEKPKRKKTSRNKAARTVQENIGNVDEIVNRYLSPEDYQYLNNQDVDRSIYEELDELERATNLDESGTAAENLTKTAYTGYDSTISNSLDDGDFNFTMVEKVWEELDMDPELDYFFENQEDFSKTTQPSNNRKQSGVTLPTSSFGHFSPASPSVPNKTLFAETLNDISESTYHHDLMQLETDLAPTFFEGDSLTPPKRPCG